MKFDTRSKANDWLRDKTFRAASPLEYGIFGTYFKKGRFRQVELTSDSRTDDKTEGLYIRGKQYRIDGSFKLRLAGDYDEDKIERLQKTGIPEVYRFNIKYYRQDKGNVTDADERDLGEAIMDACMNAVQNNPLFYKRCGLLSIYAQKEFKKEARKDSFRRYKKRVEEEKEEYKNAHEKALRARRTLKLIS